MGDSIRILGIDPGTSHVGLTVVEVAPDGSAEWISATTVKPEDLLARVFADYKVNEDITMVAIEIPEGRNGPAVKFIPPTALVAGECAGMCRVMGMDPVYMTAREWRTSMCGRGNVKDADVAESLSYFMDLPSRSNAHVRDAAGVALVVGWDVHGRMPG